LQTFYFIRNHGLVVIKRVGFLSTGDSNAPGNYALLDQVAALHWIQENIRPFGGNPSDVTLLGHGLGAALVNLLMTSPVTTGQLKQFLIYVFISPIMVAINIFEQEMF